MTSSQSAYHQHIPQSGPYFTLSGLCTTLYEPGQVDLLFCSQEEQQVATATRSATLAGGEMVTSSFASPSPGPGLPVSGNIHVHSKSKPGEAQRVARSEVHQGRDASPLAPGGGVLDADVRYALPGHSLQPAISGSRLLPEVYRQPDCDSAGECAWELTSETHALAKAGMCGHKVLGDTRC